MIRFALLISVAWMFAWPAPVLAWNCRQECPRHIWEGRLECLAYQQTCKNYQYCIVKTYRSGVTVCRDCEIRAIGGEAGRQLCNGVFIGWDFETEEPVGGLPDERGEGEGFEKSIKFGRCSEERHAEICPYVWP
ncbi:hypothetical protein KZZ07_24595 [Mameliella sp. CS4]|uniref:hypothetical protein n=1 Tax=Mameliella sp. CS4 TaxID=2862329 RepID=UPI001C5FA803|nr:hypothetical protein [Mameliella sp. CS4]MBW4985724.1 hypothetical protein [Mameliella sp. CS4]